MLAKSTEFVFVTSPASYLRDHMKLVFGFTSKAKFCLRVWGRKVTSMQQDAPKYYTLKAYHLQNYYCYSNWLLCNLTFFRPLTEICDRKYFLTKYAVTAHVLCLTAKCPQ